MCVSNSSTGDVDVEASDPSRTLREAWLSPKGVPKNAALR